MVNKILTIMGNDPIGIFNQLFNRSDHSLTSVRGGIYLN